MKLLAVGRVGVQDLTRRLSRYDREAAPKAAGHPQMTRRELRRFVKLLDRQSKRR